MPVSPRIPPLPTEALLHEAALRHIARYGCTAATLTRVLDRRVSRWQRQATPEATEVAAARDLVRQIVARLVDAGVVNDAAFAEARIRRLTRAGQSRRQVAAHLGARGLAAPIVAGLFPESPERDLATAMAAAKRRRIGPFRSRSGVDSQMARQELARLARAGFPEPIARRVLSASPEEAERLLALLRRL